MRREVSRCLLLAHLRPVLMPKSRLLTAAKRTCGDRAPRAGFDPSRTLDCAQLDKPFAWTVLNWSRRRTVANGWPLTDAIPRPNWVIGRILGLEERRSDVFVQRVTEVFRVQRVIRPCRPVRGSPVLARQRCARRFSGNYLIRVDSRFCRARPYRDKSPHCD
jgi:hypothetical protein